MDCLINVVGTGVKIDFKCREDSQKYLIEFILTYGNLDLIALAELLQVNALTLDQTRTGIIYLSEHAVEKLVEIFCMLFSD